MSKLVLTVVFAATTTVVGLVVEINLNSPINLGSPQSTIAQMLARLVSRGNEIDNPIDSTLLFGGSCHARTEN